MADRVQMTTEDGGMPDEMMTNAPEVNEETEKVIEDTVSGGDEKGSPIVDDDDPESAGLPVPSFNLNQESGCVPDPT